MMMLLVSHFIRREPTGRLEYNLLRTGRGARCLGPSANALVSPRASSNTAWHRRRTPLPLPPPPCIHLRGLIHLTVVNLSVERWRSRPTDKWSQTEATPED